MNATHHIPRTDGPPFPSGRGARALFRLHKALIDSERAQFERGAGPLSSGAFLQVLLGDESFAWLRPFSGLVVKIDEALAAADPITYMQAHAYIREVHDLVLDSSDPVANHRLGEVLKRGDAAVQFAEGELTRRIAAALTAPLH